MRQNPSVELNDNGGPGRVKVGIPEARVWQTSDGSVRIQYDAGNPFAPGIATDTPWPMENNPVTVNGDLVFTPAADGVRVDGTRTNYPSMEIYQDLPNGSTRTVLIDPAAAGSSAGPGMNLWRTTNSEWAGVRSSRSTRVVEPEIRRPSSPAAYRVRYCG